MRSDKQSQQGFQVRYYKRQKETNRWEATTKRLEGFETRAEGVKVLSTTRWEGETQEDENHATIFVSVNRDPRLFDLSPESEEAWIAMFEKANQIADSKFLARHPDAKIEHNDIE